MKRSRGIRPFIYLLALMTMLLSAEASQAATFYTATTGNDTNPGTQALPFRTLLKGVRALTAGDTLIVKGGTYNEVLLNVIPSGTSWSQPVTVKAASGETVIIQAPAIADGVVAFVGIGAKYIILDGLILDANRLGLFAFSIDAGAAYIRVMNCEIKNSIMTGMLIAPGQMAGTDVGCCNEFINLDVHHNGNSGLDHGIYIGTSKNTVESSRFYKHIGYGVHVYNSYGGVNDNTIRSNLSYHNTSGGFWVGKGSGHLVYNNISWGNGSGIILSSNNSKIYNNTFYKNDSDPRNGGLGIIILGSVDRGVEIKNNIVYANPSGDIYGVTHATVSNNLVGKDPKFVDVANANFRLTSTSPAINTGTTISVVLNDFEGVARPQGSSYDIGAYEYGVN